MNEEKYDEGIVSGDTDVQGNGPEETADGNVYIYDADDEPVDDRDLYRDYSADAVIAHHKDEQIDAVPISDAGEQAFSEAVGGTAGSEPDIAAGENIEEQENVHAPSDNETEAARQAPSKTNRISFINTVISMVTLCVAAAGIFTGFAYIRIHDQQLKDYQRRVDLLEERINDNTGSENSNAGREYVDAVSLIDEEEMNEPDVPADKSVDIERGKILTYDSYVGYSWVPVLSGVKPNTYRSEDFIVDDDNRMTYKVDGEVSSYFGIDVSSYQGDIDWNAVRADGVEFAVLRIGVRGYGEAGNIKVDDKFFDNYKGAKEAGIDIGVYFYSQAISVEEAIEEAEFVIEHLDGRDLEYPVVFDWEPVDASSTDSEPRTADVMPGTLTLSAIAFCETIKDAGYEAMIYTNKKMAYLKYDMRMLDDYPVWLALYNPEMTYYYDFDMWQYGFGKIDGIEGDVDLDIAIIR